MAGLVIHDGKFLIAKRPPDVHLGGLWEFPGGKMEPGESLENCLRRELREELGIVVGEARLFRVISHRYSDRTIDLHFLTCSLEEHSQKPSESDVLRWVSPEELPHFIFPPANSLLLAELYTLVARGV